MPIGWALLGPGRHAEQNVVPQLAQSEGTKLVGVLSRELSRGRSFAERHGFEKAFSSLDDLLRDPEVDAVYDATPDGLHAANLIRAAAAGKHVLVEKPLALSPAQGRAAVEAARRHGVQLGVVFNQRHDAAHQRARQLVADGRLGDIVFAKVQIALRTGTGGPAPYGGNWRADRGMRSGGILMSIGDHAYDTLAFIAGQTPLEVCAFTDASGARDERAAAMMLKLSGGAIGYASASSRIPHGRTPFEFHGTQGSLILEGTYAYLSGADGTESTLSWKTGTGMKVERFAATPCFRLEVEQFNRAIRGEGTPMTTGEEGLSSLAVAEALYASIASGRVTRVAVFLTAP